MTKLDQMIIKAQNEAAASWAVAIASTTQVHEWSNQDDALAANKGFSVFAFVKNKRGNWVIA